jgi:predicted anti-sigma-YlaC factor YlaD
MMAAAAAIRVWKGAKTRLRHSDDLQHSDGNLPSPGGDLADVDCERWQEAISARLDGEDPGIDGALVDAHLERCPACRAFASDAAAVRPGQRIGLAAHVPDLARRVRKAVALSDRTSRWSIARALLLVVAVEIVSFSLPALVLGDEHDTSAHAARHLGAFTAAYGVGLLVVAVRPARARTMLPVAVVLAGALLITAVVDLVNGRIPLVGEAQHIPELLSVVLIWLLALPAPRRAAASVTGRPPLRAVPHDETEVA